MKKILLTILIVVLSLVYFMSGAKALPSEYDGDMIIVALAGQSNASGRGTLSSNRPTDPLMWIFGDDYHWYPGREPSDKKGTYRVDVVNWDSGAGYSAGYSIAEHIHLHYPGQPVGIVNCAKGATSITQWRPSREENTLFGACMKKVYAALSQGNLAFVFFYQGESDALVDGKTIAPEWDAYFANYVDSMRMKFGSDLPIIYAQIGKSLTTRHPYWSVVQERQAAYSAPMTAMITTNDLPLMSDGVHLTTEAQNEVGARVVEAWCGLVGCP